MIGVRRRPDRRGDPVRELDLRRGAIETQRILGPAKFVMMRSGVRVSLAGLPLAADLASEPSEGTFHKSASPFQEPPPDHHACNIVHKNERRRPRSGRGDLFEKRRRLMADGQRTGNRRIASACRADARGSLRSPPQFAQSPCEPRRAREPRDPPSNCSPACRTRPRPSDPRPAS